MIHVPYPGSASRIYASCSCHSFACNTPSRSRFLVLANRHLQTPSFPSQTSILSHRGLGSGGFIVIVAPRVRIRGGRGCRLRALCFGRRGLAVSFWAGDVWGSDSGGGVCAVHGYRVACCSPAFSLIIGFFVRRVLVSLSLHLFPTTFTLRESSKAFSSLFFSFPHPLFPR